MCEKANFRTERDLCEAFISQTKKYWIAYPETGGFDILMVRRADGIQLGIEAKLTLNSKVIMQIVEGNWPLRSGPDFRAVLIPRGTKTALAGLCDLLAITVIEMMDREQFMERKRQWMFPRKIDPALPVAGEPGEWFISRWHDWCPDERCTVPDYIPDVAAGASAPMALTDWKVKAIKIAVTLEIVGSVCRKDFEHHRISHQRWINPQIGWLARGAERGLYVAGRFMPDFRRQHPVNYEQIKADYEIWKRKDV